MIDLNYLQAKIFNALEPSSFELIALQLFQIHYQHNTIYRQYCDLLAIDVAEVNTLGKIPFLPISFFKQHAIQLNTKKTDIIFTSSATTSSVVSQHFVEDVTWYQKSFKASFAYFYGDPYEFCWLALLPAYTERKGSSLVYMIDDFIQHSIHSESAYFLNEDEKLIATIQQLQANKPQAKIILLGVSFALLDLAEKYQLDFSRIIVMETGGMKGRRKEWVRSELHHFLNQRFNTRAIHSEYGMTELLSQAYSKGNGIFEETPWLKIFIRDVNDPFTYLPDHFTGAINVIDLANVYSCPFIETQDIGKKNSTNSFEILGRIDNSDVRGCNLLLTL